MGADARTIAVRFVGDASGLEKAADQGAAATSKFSDRTQKAATAGLAGVAAVGVGLAGLVKGGLEGLREGEEAEARFAQAFSKVPPAVGLSKAAIMEHAEAIQANTRFSYEDALATNEMLVAQDGVQAALRAGVVSMDELTNITLDLATAQGKDGPAAATMLAKALAAPEKATGALRKAGIALSAAEQAKIKAWTEAGKTGEAQALILDKVKAKTEGAANAAGDTTAGKIARSQAAFGEMQESLAQGLIPVMETLTNWGLKISTWLQDNPGKVKVAVIVLGSLAAVVGVVSLAIKAWTFVTKIHTAVMWALNVAMNANPAVRIATMIGLLAAAIVVAWKKSETFRAIVTGAFNAVKGAAQGAFNWVKSNWPLILAIITGPIGLAVLAVVKNWDRIKAGASKMKDGIVTVFSGIADVITAPFKAAFNAIASAWNNGPGRLSFSVPGWVPGIGGNGFDVPDIPMLAAGGRVTARGWAMVGENGPELLNLRRGAQVVPLDRGGGGGATQVRVFIGERELTDIVKVEVRETNREMSRAAGARSRKAFV